MSAKTEVAASLLKDNKPLKIAITVIISAAAVAVTGWAVNKYVIAAIKGDPSKDASKEAGKEVNKNNLTYKNQMSRYRMIADAMYRAMDGAGTDVDAIYNQANYIKNIDDWKQVIYEFGSRETTSMVSKFKGNLIEWLTDELDISEVNKLNTILKKANVTV